MLILLGTTKTGKIKDTTLIEGKAHYNAKTNTLTLDNVITNEPIIYRGAITIILIGENTITGLRHALFPIESEEDILTIKGEGSLCIEGIIRLNKLSVKDCTLYMRHHRLLAEIKSLTAEKANIIIEYSNRLTNVHRELKECSIVYKSYDYDNQSDVLIIQKDRKKNDNKRQ